MRNTVGRFIFPALFLAYLLAGILVHTDYGISWDEEISRSNGLVNLKYLEERFKPELLTDVVKAAPDLDTWMDRDYGVAFELPLVALEQAFDVQGEHIYPFRHLLTFLFCSLGVLAVYGTAMATFRNRGLAILAALMLMLSPRLFAESFYNSKDAVFLSLTAISTFTLTKLLNRPRIWWAVAHGVACGFATDVRIMGLTTIGISLAFLAAMLLKKQVRPATITKVALAYIVTTVLVVVAMFPFLWGDPWGNFMFSFSNMAKFRWNNHVLYLGELYRATQLPWHYLPVWILASTPLAYSALVLAGAWTGIGIIVRNRLALWKDNLEMVKVLHLSLLFLPLIAIIAIRAVVYDGWRHVYFIYPAFILVATSGVATIFNWIGSRAVLRKAFIAILAVALLSSGYFIVRSHPLQNVYFNALVGKNWKDKFDLDYWGLGNTDALRYILRNEDSRWISIKPNSATPLERATLLLPAEERNRVVLAPSDSEPEFILTNYRAQSLFKDPSKLKNYALYYEKRVLGEPVLAVFKMRDGYQSGSMTAADRTYSPDEFRALSYAVAATPGETRASKVKVTITNAGATPFAVYSVIGKQIHVVWRVVDENGQPAADWQGRTTLPKDIPAHGTLTLYLAVDPAVAAKGSTLEVSMVQELAFWAHEIGVPPATMPWPPVDPVEVRP